MKNRICGPWAPFVVLSTTLTLAACGDDSTATGSDSGSDGSTTTTATNTSGDPGTDTGTESSGEPTAGSESESQGSTEEPTTEGPTTEEPTTTDQTTDDPTDQTTDPTEATTDDPTTTTDDPTTTTDDPTDDPTDDTTTTGNQCEQQCGNDEWSYAWIANSGEHTVTKLDTRTLVEEGRYRTRPDGSGSPSRTSVSIDGRAVVIANRFGGLTKIWARQEDCIDKNNDGIIQTSTGKNDVLPFDQDECIAWHNPFSDYTVQRPVAWTSGVYNEETCEYDDQKIWTTTGNSGSPGQCGQTGIWVHRVNGDSGEVEDTIHIPHAEVPCTIGNIEWGLGPYGAAVDPDNNMWFFVWAQSKMVRVDHETLEYEVFSGGSYGLTVDTMGRVWDDIPRRFDYQSQTWSSPIGDIPGAGGSGVAEDLQGRIWSATQGGVGWVDMETMVVGDIIPLPGNNLYRGISVDIDGFIWAIQLGGTSAYKIDPETYEYEFYDGLNSPYTYSDMTGGQLNKVTCIPM